MARIVFVGDDFTGASDTLATLAERGAAVRLFLDVPDESEADGLDAVGIATDLRSRPAGEITARLAVLAPAIAALAPRFVHYKVCSTFDSAPHVGSIGAAVTALEAAISPAHTIVLGGQPSLGRHCLFGTLFARAPDGETYRIDRHPIMSRHPVTPMDEADLRIHLARQGLDGLGLLDHPRLREAHQGFRVLFPATGRTLVDAVDQTDVERLGVALREATGDGPPLLLIGASSVAEALADPSTHAPERAASPAARATGPVLAIAGSRSSATAAQVAAAASHVRVPLTAADLEADLPGCADHCARLLGLDRHVLVHLQPGLDYGLSSTALSERLADLAAAILDRRSVGRIAVAGGDTSSAVVKRLGFRSLSFVERAGAGVAVCRGHAPGHPLDGTLLLLKGGQVGATDLFERFAGDPGGWAAPGG
jgi:3-oxoisoapionate kinase